MRQAARRRPAHARAALNLDPDVRRYIRCVGIAAVVATLLYLPVLGGLLDSRPFGNFYDIQARALLHGHIDVPTGSLAIEAFVQGGKQYMYFPPGPALLRMPVFVLTDAYDGRLTAVSMLLAWSLTVVLLASLQWRVRRIILGSAPLGRLEAVGHAFLLLASTAGSVLLFLAAVPWVYHEAYAWAVAMAVGFAFSLLGVVQRPYLSRVIATSAFAIGAIMSRTTVGWACSAAIALAAVVLPASSPRHPRNLWWKLWVAAALPVAVGMAVNWAKFRHPFLFPIDHQVFTRLSAHRREAIAANGGDLFSPGLIWSTLVNYFSPLGIRFVRIFPFITLPPHIPRSYGGGFIDQANRTGSVADFAPLLFSLTVVGIALTLRPRAELALRRFRLPMLGLGAIPLGILFYAYIANRYTAEFAPLLYFGGAIGFVELHRRVLHRSRRTRIAYTGAVVALATFSVLASLATALTARALAQPATSTLTAYVDDQRAVSGWTGDPLDGYVDVSDELPPTGAADRIHIVGDCDSYFIGSGDEFGPWVEIESREVAVAVTPRTTVAQDGIAVITTFSGHHVARLELERRASGDFRILLAEAGIDAATDWFDGHDGFRVDVKSPSPYFFTITVTGLPSGAPQALLVERTVFDADWVALPNVVRQPTFDVAVDGAIGATLQRIDTPQLGRCEDLLRNHRGG